MIEIDLGYVYLIHSGFRVTVCLTDGYFSHFIVVSRKGMITIKKWYFNDKEDSDPLYHLIKEASSRFDALEALLRRNREDGIVDFKAYSQLVKLGIDVSTLIESKIEVHGSRHYEILDKPQKALKKSPPERNQYSNHSSYRKAMNCYIQSMSFNQKSVSLSAVEVPEPSSSSITAYNESIALFKYQQGELDLLETTK